MSSHEKAAAEHQRRRCDAWLQVEGAKELILARIEREDRELEQDPQTKSDDAQVASPFKPTALTPLRPHCDTSPSLYACVWLA